MLKFQRNYKAEFEIGHREKNVFIAEEVITISYPITCYIQVDTGCFGTANSATFQFLNLSRQTQAKLWLDMYNVGKRYVTMHFYAGYGENMPLVFQGNFQECISYRQAGSVDWITQMQVFEGGYLYRYGYANSTYVKGTKIQDVIKSLLEIEPNIELGYLSPKIPDLPRNKTFIGQTMDLLGREYGGYEVFIEKGKLNIIDSDEVIAGDIQVISPETGLLGSPRRANIFTEIDTIFEPGLYNGQAVSLITDTQERYNQLYKIVSIKHNGVISPRINDKLITTTTLALLTKPPKRLTPVKYETFKDNETTGIWEKPIKNGRITSSFGYRTTNIKGASTNHEGIDIGAAINTPVYAPANGRVFMANWYGGYGKCVQIDNGTINGKKVSSLYGHLNQWNVTNGQQVYKGQTIIGYVGSTGISDGPHLHFTIKENGIPVDPTIYIGTY